MKIALIVLLGLAGLILTAAILAGPQLQTALSSFTPEPPSTKVRIQKVANGKLVETVKAPGRIEPHTKVDISSEVSARIEKLPFDVGDVARKGDLVVKLDDKDLQASLAATEARKAGEEFRLQSEEARLTGLLSSLALSKRQYDRKKALFDSGDLSQKDYDEATQHVEDLQAQVDSTKHSISVVESSLISAKADIDQAKERLAKTVIVAPMDGIITALNAEVGEVVLVGTMNNPGTVILTIADLSRMIMKAEVAESDIAKIAEGQPAKVHINAYRDKVFSGTVTQVALQRTDLLTNGAGTGFFEAEVEIDLQGETVRSGHDANVDIEISSHEGLVVESQAIVDRLIEEMPEDIKRDNPLVDLAKKTTTVVYRMVNNKSVCTPVKRGSSDDTHSIVLAGLDAGESVVIGPYKALEALKHDERLTDERESKDKEKGKGDSNSELADDGSKSGSVTVKVGS